MSCLEEMESEFFYHCIFEEQRYDALINTGVTRSFLDISVIEQAHLPIHRAHGNIYLGHRHRNVSRTGYTYDIKVEYSNRTAMTSFEVFDLKYPFVIG